MSMLSMVYDMRSYVRWCLVAAECDSVGNTGADTAQNGALRIARTELVLLEEFSGFGWFRIPKNKRYLNSKKNDKWLLLGQDV